MNFLSLWPFSNFYLIFKLIFINIPYLKIAKRRFLPAGADVASRATGVLTWRAGPPRGCDAAPRPCGRATGGPRGAQVAHKARTRGRWPRSPRGPQGRP